MAKRGTLQPTATTRLPAFRRSRVAFGWTVVLAALFASVLDVNGEEPGLKSVVVRFWTEAEVKAGKHLRAEDSSRQVDQADFQSSPEVISAPEPLWIEADPGQLPIPSVEAAQPLEELDAPTLDEFDEEAEEIDDGLRPITAIRTSIIPSSGDLPDDYAAIRFAKEGEYLAVPQRDKPWMGYAYSWQSSAYCHGPLYFEQINLERYGYTHGIWTPALSAAHFFGSIPLLPYKMALHSPHEARYSLGYYRPGSAACPQRHRLEWRLDAAAVQAGTIAGLILLIP